MKLAPSLLAADFGKLRAEASQVEPLADYLHVDVMDGHFVPNLTIGPPVVNSLRRGLSRPFDIHLMIDNPREYAPHFHVFPGDFITFHIEIEDSPARVIDKIKQTGARVGISLRPGTPVEALFPWLDSVDLVLVMSVEPGFGGQSFMGESIERIRRLREEIRERPVTISVDGGIDVTNIAAVVRAGVGLVVAGSAIFSAQDRLAAMRALQEAAGG
jgi:ribulose-phosphate 3-epimerase